VEADFECLSGRKRVCCPSVSDKKKFVEVVIWIGKNGGRWRCLPEEYGKWGAASASVSSAGQTREFGR
jgi:transposase